MQWTIRDVPPELDSRVREVAREKGLSLNKAVLQVVESSLGGGLPFGKKRDLSRFIEKISKVNSKKDMRAMDRVWKVVERIGPEEWR